MPTATTSRASEYLIARETAALTTSTPNFFKNWLWTPIRPSKCRLNDVPARLTGHGDNHQRRASVGDAGANKQKNKCTSRSWSKSNKSPPPVPSTPSSSSNLAAAVAASAQSAKRPPKAWWEYECQQRPVV